MGSCPWGPLIHMQGPGGVCLRVGGEGRTGTIQKRAAWTVLSGGARGRLWHLAFDSHPHLCPCPQGDTRQGPGPWCPCYGSAPGPTSSPTACHLLSLAVPPRPWTCSWRAMPSSSLWQPRPSGAVPGRGGAGWGWGELVRACPRVPAQAYRFCLCPHTCPQQIALGLSPFNQGLPARAPPSSLSLPLPAISWYISLSMTLCLPILYNPVFSLSVLVCLFLCWAPHLPLLVHPADLGTDLGSRGHQGWV